MEHITVGKKYNAGKIAYVECVENGTLSHIDIKDECFLLVCLLQGRLSFKLNGVDVSAAAPCFFCFNEKEAPTLISKSKAHYYCIYFHPKFLNVNMTFELLYSEDYGDIATVHDMFMLKPFVDGQHVVPICDNYRATVENSCIRMGKELTDQRDWYWSCRGRSHFMEIIIALERMYGLIGYGEGETTADSTPALSSAKLKDAVLFIEGHYMEDLSLLQIAAACGINKTTLTDLFKEELNVTAMQYLMKHRIKVAKKQLAFTEVPLKDVADRCGFKTVQHFSRVFKAHTGDTPADYRKKALLKRKNEIN